MEKVTPISKKSKKSDQPLVDLNVGGRARLEVTALKYLVIKVYTARIREILAVACYLYAAKNILLRNGYEVTVNICLNRVLTFKAVYLYPIDKTRTAYKRIVWVGDVTLCGGSTVR